MSIIEDYPGTVESIRKCVDRNLPRSAIKRIMGPLVSEAEIDQVIGALRNGYIAKPPEKPETPERRKPKAVKEPEPAREPEPEPEPTPEPTLTPEEIAAADEAKRQARIAEIEREIEILFEEAAALHRTPTVREIMLTVCDREGIPVKEMLSQGRNRRLTTLRHEIMYLAASMTLLSLPTIGRAMNRDHTSVLHGIREHAARNNLRLPRGMAFRSKIQAQLRACGQDVGNVEKSSRASEAVPDRL